MNCISKFRTVFLLSLILLSLAVPLTTFKPAAADSSYNGGNLIDDPIFLNAGSMNIAAIQSFLAGKGGFLASYTPQMDCSPGLVGQTSHDAYVAAGAPCGQTVSAATIMYYASQVYGVNPQVILATIQKEQGLVTAPTYDEYKIDYAMGFGCPTSAGCGATANSNFMYQIDNGTWDLRYMYERARGNTTYWNTAAWACNGGNQSYYTPNLYPNQNVTFKDDNGTAYATYYIANASTSSFYCYTPHTLNNFPGCTPAYGFSYSSSLPTVGSTGLCYAGSGNFSKYFNVWFGSPYAFIYNGLSYSPVFDANYYLNSNPDLKAAFSTNQMAAFNHFITNGMKEGRQGSASFDVNSYRNRYTDLRWAFGTNLPAYYWHYLVTGRAEGRTATGAVTLQPVTQFGGVDYSNVYDFNWYTSNNLDIQKAYANDDTGALWHFVTIGMTSGRQGNANFNVQSYMARYPDLRNAFGTTNLRSYYIHYMTTGKNEGRTATGNYLGGTTVYNKTDYASIYNFDYYEKSNPDIQKIFGLNDNAAIQHFVNTGMNEGRQGSAEFNVYAYQSENPDLRAAFGNNLRLYYMHYLTTGKAEGRSGT